MIVNLSHINASNGMFWFAIDKIKTVHPIPAVILVKPGLAWLVERELPGANVKEVSKFAALGVVLRSRLNRRHLLHVISFTPHPIPFVSNQTIAFYDDYPFHGLLGRVKRLLFEIGVRTSRCQIGIINRSLAMPFLRKCKVQENRIFFDSALPTISRDQERARESFPEEPIAIGLVGTDSLKKDYESIFRAVVELGREQDIHFYLYGEQNDYTRRLRSEYRTVQVSVVSSDTHGLSEFFNMIDYLISASRSEGYGRPMGFAAAIGVPLFLLKSPVFLEFFGSHATFFDEIADLIRHIIERRPPIISDRAQLHDTSLAKSGFFRHLDS